MEKMTVLVTGGYGFIGSNLVRRLLTFSVPIRIILIDSSTYAARPDWLYEFRNSKFRNPEVELWNRNVDIRDATAVSRVMRTYKPDLVYHLAAESHVCRSIAGPRLFMETNLMGTFNLIEEFYQLHKGDSRKKFVHISTDEVFGELEREEPAFSPETQIKPRSPYAASKAGSDHIVQAYHHTYGVPTIITNCSNNFGPNQHEEKLVPATILRLLEGKKPRLYGDGQNRRDWLFVDDHVEALIDLVSRGTPGERYTIGGLNELTNMEMVKKIGTSMGIEILDFEFTDDRPTDDKRYAVDCSKTKQIGWKPSHDFEKNLATTIEYYVRNWKRDGAVRESGLKAGDSHE